MAYCERREDLIGFYSILELNVLLIEPYRTVLLTGSELNLVKNYCLVELLNEWSLLINKLMKT